MPISPERGSPQLLNPEIKEGLYPSFLLRNIVNFKSSCCNRVLEGECAILRILAGDFPPEKSTYSVNANGVCSNISPSVDMTVADLSLFSINAVIYSQNFHFSLRATVNSPIITFSCFDEVQLIFSNLTKVYLFNLNCCKKWGVRTVRAVSPYDPSDFISFTISIENARTVNPCNDLSVNGCMIRSLDAFRDGYHYNVNEAVLHSKYVPIILSTFGRMTVREYQCPLCFIVLRNRRLFVIHIGSLHPSYSLSYSEGVFTASYTRDIPNFNISQESTNGSIDLLEDPPVTVVKFCSTSHSSNENEVSDGYIDFCSLIGKNTVPNYNNKDNIINSNDIPDVINKYDGDTSNTGNIDNASERLVSFPTTRRKAFNGNIKPLYFPSGDPIEHSNAIHSHKNDRLTGKFDGGMMIFFIRPFEVDDNPLPVDCHFTKFNISLKSFLISPDYSQDLTAMYIYNGNTFISSNASIKYLKSRSSKVFDYKFKGYGLLIEREYDTIDYSGMTSSHLNMRIDQHRRDGRLKEMHYEVMKTWNVLSMEETSPEASLRRLIGIYGLTGPCVEMIEVLYTRGLLNSEEILKAMSQADQLANNKRN